MRTLFITRKCVLGQFLLTPDRPLIGRIFLYLVAFFAQFYGVQVHAICVLANHYHAVLTDCRGQLPHFLQQLHQLVARTVNDVRERKGALWDERHTSVVQCASPNDAFESLIYTLTNPVKDHLVERAHHWPGLSSLNAMLGGRTVRCRRPNRFFGRRTAMPEFAEIRFARLPGFEHLTQEQWNDKVLTAVRAVEADAARQRAENRAARDAARAASAKGNNTKKVRLAEDVGDPARRITRVLGCRAIKRQKPTAAPPPKPRSKGKACQLNPTLAAKDPTQRRILLGAQRAWRGAYRKALEAHQNGDRHVIFPYGTWQRRLHSAVDCTAAPGLVPLPYAAALREAA